MKQDENSNGVAVRDDVPLDGLEAAMARPAREATSQPAAYRMVTWEELTPALIDRWLELTTSNAALDSPYFHPGFTAAVAATSPGIHVVLGEDASGAVTSFLPVALERRAARPAGSPAADFQGPVCAPGTDFDIGAAVRSCGLTSLRFDHLRDGLAGFEPWIQEREVSPYLEVEGGIDGYLTRASKSGKDKVSEARRLTRKAEREHGAIRFVADAVDADLLDATIELKRRQYATTGARDYFADRSHVALLHQLMHTREAGFGGQLSAVYTGESLLAVHFGIRSGSVLHWWFPVYNPEFSRLSPGWVLLRAVIDAAPELGITRIDLGRGLDDYKRRAMTGQEVVCRGAVFSSPWRRTADVGRQRALTAVKSSRVAPALRQAVHFARRRSG